MRARGVCAAGMCVLLVAGFAATALADGSRAGAFRLPGYGARAWAMAGAAVASVDDESAVYWNPAMLGVLKPRAAVGVSYVNLVEGSTAQMAQMAYARVFPSTQPGGVEVNRHAIGLLYTSLNLHIAGNKNYDENHIRLVYAFTPDRYITVAGGFEYFFSNSDVDGFDAAGTSVDGSVRLALTKNLNTGVMVRNAFSRYSFDDDLAFSKERTFVAGVAYHGLPYTTTELDLVREHTGLSRILIGAETDYLAGYLALRAGFAYLQSGESRGIPYMGFGLRGFRERFALHYNANFDSEEALGSTHRFSLSVTL